MADLSVVMEKLHAFETADDLAEYFRSYGITAQPLNARACPITKFVMEETGLFDIVTNDRAIIVYDDDCSGARINHTAAMTQFVYNYDSGGYEFLVEEGFEINVHDSCDCNSCLDAQEDLF